MNNKKRGEGYVQVCVLIIIVCMLLSVFITLIGAVNAVRITRRNIKTVLQSYVMSNSIKIYDSIKQGNNEIETIDSTEFVNSLSVFCTFDKNGSFLYHKDSEGQPDYYISIPQIGINDGKLELTVDYTLYVPLYFSGVYAGTVQIPDTVKIYLYEKY